MQGIRECEVRKQHLYFYYSVTEIQHIFPKCRWHDFPSGTADRNPPANAGNMGLIPDLKRCHVQWATKLTHCNYWARPLQLLKPRCLEPVLSNNTSHQNEKPLHSTKMKPCSLQLEKAYVQQGRPGITKNEINNLKKIEATNHFTVENMAIFISSYICWGYPKYNLHSSLFWDYGS